MGCEDVCRLVESLDVVVKSVFHDSPAAMWYCGEG